MTESLENEKSGIFVWRIRKLEVLDGDTPRAEVDFGLNVFMKVDVRLGPIDTPEMRGKDKEYGKKVKQIVQDWVESKPITDLRLVSHEWVPGKEKYHRVLGDIISIAPNSVSLVDFLLFNKLGRLYLGQNKKDVPPFDYEAIEKVYKQYFE